jgi:hypothetical protein
MFIFAYLLFSNVLLTAGVLFALATQSRRRAAGVSGIRSARRPLPTPRRGPDA